MGGWANGSDCWWISNLFYSILFYSIPSCSVVFYLYNLAIFSTDGENDPTGIPTLMNLILKKSRWLGHTDAHNLVVDVVKNMWRDQCFKPFCPSIPMISRDHSDFQVMLCFDSIEDLPSFTQQNGHPSRYIIAFFGTPRHGFETSTPVTRLWLRFPRFLPPKLVKLKGSILLTKAAALRDSNRDKWCVNQRLEFGSESMGFPMALPAFQRFVMALRTLISSIIYHPDAWDVYIRVFPKNGGENPQNGWWKSWKTIELDDLGGNPTIFGNIHMFFFSTFGKGWSLLGRQPCVFFFFRGGRVWKAGGNWIAAESWRTTVFFSHGVSTAGIIISEKCLNSSIVIWAFPKIGVPQNGWFIMENPIKMDDLGIPLFLEISICYLSLVLWFSCLPDVSGRDHRSSLLWLETSVWEGSFGSWLELLW